MNVVLFTWNPDLLPLSDRTWNREIRQIQESGFLFGSWSTGNTTKLIQPGDIAFLLRQSNERGIVSGGIVTSTVFQETSWRDDSEDEDIENYVEITWTSQVPINDRLTIETLRNELPEINWVRQSSGTTVEEIYHDKLCQLWKETLRNAGYPNDQFPQPAKSTNSGSAGEGLASANSQSIEQQKGQCAICGIDSGGMYEIPPTKFLVQLENINGNPAVAVCPNCYKFAKLSPASATLAELQAQLHVIF